MRNRKEDEFGDEETQRFIHDKKHEDDDGKKDTGHYFAVMRNLFYATMLSFVICKIY